MMEAFGTPERLHGSAIKTAANPTSTSSVDSQALLLKSRDMLKAACAKFVCGACKSPSTTLMVDGAELLCVGCASDHAVPLPMQLTEAFKDIRTVYSDISEHIHANQKVKIRVKKLGASPDRPLPTDGSGFVQLNPNITPGKSDSRPVDFESQDNSADLVVIVDGLLVTESRNRDDISTAEAQARVELMQQQALHFKQTKAKHRDSSRTLKSLGDRKYEEMKYEAAIEHYTQALKTNDGTTAVSAMLGNRSAAHFMLHMWPECIEDCLAAAEAEANPQPQTKAKLFQRASKAAGCMGQLRQAAELLSMIPENARTGEIEQERQRFLRGAELIDSLETAPNREAIDTLRMLVTDFGESTSLRIRLAKVYMSIGDYGRADSALELVPQLTPETALLRAQSLYMQGFERVPEAIKVLEPFAESPLVQPELRRVAGMENGKQSGNNFFSNSRFAESVEQYSNALAHAEGVPNIMKILYCNRAASFKEMKKYREGLQDCTIAIEIDKKFGKAYTRRARCLLALECYAGAMRDFQSALSLTSSPDEARSLEAEIRGVERAEKAAAERDKDYYAVMELTVQATEKDVKKQYKLLSLKWHPDKCMSLSEDEREMAEQRFKKISEAYGVLSDEIKRREYDLKRQRASTANDFRYADPTRSRFPNAAPPQQWARQPGKFW